ncbi:MAG: serpin family protein [Cyclobacteriaceae bacterium]
MKTINLSKITVVFFALFTSLLFAQCSEEEPIGNQKNPPDLRPISGSTEALVETSNSFAIDLFQSIRQNKADENIFISPLSVDIALHMAVNGATGETKEVMKETLGVAEMSDEEVNQAAKLLIEQLLSMDQEVALAIANSIWFRDAFTLQSGFDQLIQEHYDGRIEGLNFDNPEAKETINQWVEDQTQGKIQNLIQQIKDSDVMFLINAIYYKANWQYQFDKSETREAPFYLGDGSNVTASLMSNEATKVNYNYEEELQIIEIPYGNGQFNMVILLPQGGNTVASLMDGLTIDQLSNWLEQTDTLTTHLMIPKFKTEFKLDMSDVLKGMGMELPFTTDANFGGFFNEIPGEKLFLDRVIHQAFIEVNEEGSEAAAATAVAIGVESINLERPDLIRVDRPFAYFIREKHTQAILFAGTMLNPAN